MEGVIRESSLFGLSPSFCVGHLSPAAENAAKVDSIGRSEIHFPLFPLSDSISLSSKKEVKDVLTFNFEEITNDQIYIDVMREGKVVSIKFTEASPEEILAGFVGFEAKGKYFVTTDSPLRSGEKKLINGNELEVVRMTEEKSSAFKRFIENRISSMQKKEETREAVSNQIPVEIFLQQRRNETRPLKNLLLPQLENRSLYKFQNELRLVSQNGIERERAFEEKLEKKMRQTLKDLEKYLGKIVVNTKINAGILSLSGSRI